MRMGDTYTTEFVLAGVEFSWWTTHDGDSDPPWKQDESHGNVVAVRHTRDKEPGSRVITNGGRNQSAYEYAWADTVKRARMEGWGLSAKSMAALQQSSGRVPTKGMIAAAAVQEDFDRIKAWLNDEWHYVGVCVVKTADLRQEGSVHAVDYESLWGIESDDEAYHAKVAEELAFELLDPLRRAVVTAARQAAAAEHAPGLLEAA